MKKTRECIRDAAESYCNCDLVEKCIRSSGSWNLLVVSLQHSKNSYSKYVVYRISADAFNIQSNAF
jgi:hypothetical protein